MILRIIIGVLFVIMSFTANVQNQSGKPLNSRIDSSFKDKPNFGLDGFMYLDRVILASMPTQKDYKKLTANIIGLPKDHIRYIDSIDYYVSPKDTVNIIIYSQNYAYQSTNGYKLGKQKGSPAGLLVMNKVFDINFTMKSEVEDIEKYRNSNFDIEVFETTIKENKERHRFIISKIFR